MSSCSLPIALRGRKASNGHTDKWATAAYPMHWEEEKHPMGTQVNDQLQPTHCTEKKSVQWTHRQMNICSLPIALRGRKTSHGYKGKWATAAYPMHWQEEKHPMETQVNKQLQPTQCTVRKKNIPWKHGQMSNCSLPIALRGRKTSHGHTGKWSATAHPMHWEEEKHPKDTQVYKQLQPTHCTERNKKHPMDTNVNEQLQPTHCTERKKNTSHGHTDKLTTAAYPLHWEEEKQSHGHTGK